MTTAENGELVAALIVVMWIPHLVDSFAYLMNIGFRVMTDAEAEVMTIMILPLMGVCLLSWFIMGIGYWIDSGGLDI